MRRFGLALVLVVLGISFGCTTGLTPGPYRRPPRRIDWQDPVSVMRGFLSAKRRGDWRTAYSCCDYSETLSSKENATIKKKWKEECDTWPTDYADIRWQIAGGRYEGDTAAVRIVVLHRDPITGLLKTGATYEERLKKYKDKWKITNPFAEGPSE